MKYKCKGAFLRQTKIKNRGINNTLEIGKGCRLYNCTIGFYGDNNDVVIDHDCECRDMDIWIEGGGLIHIKHNSHFNGDIHIACIEGKKCEIGERCLFSDRIVIRTGDSHSVLSLSGERLNPARDVYIGDHVWIGQAVTILKGAVIGNETIVGTGTIVTGKEYEGNTVIAGSPGKVIKREVTWHHNLI